MARSGKAKGGEKPLVLKSGRVIKQDLVLKQVIDLSQLSIDTRKQNKRMLILRTPGKSFLIEFRTEEQAKDWLGCIGRQASLRRKGGRVGSGHTLMVGTIHAAAGQFS